MPCQRLATTTTTTNTNNNPNNPNDPNKNSHRIREDADLGEAEDRDPVVGGRVVQGQGTEGRVQRLRVVVEEGVVRRMRPGRGGCEGVRVCGADASEQGGLSAEDGREHDAARTRHARARTHAHAHAHAHARSSSRQPPAERRARGGRTERTRQQRTRRASEKRQRESKTQPRRGRPQQD
eukprot:184644-Rhodomonas_salina.2